MLQRPHQPHQNGRGDRSAIHAWQLRSAWNSFVGQRTDRFHDCSHLLIVAATPNLSGQLRKHHRRSRPAERTRIAKPRHEQPTGTAAHRCERRHAAPCIAAIPQQDLREKVRSHFLAETASNQRQLKTHSRIWIVDSHFHHAVGQLLCDIAIAHKPLQKPHGTGSQQRIVCVERFVKICDTKRPKPIEHIKGHDAAPGIGLRICGQHG